MPKIAVFGNARGNHKKYWFLSSNLYGLTRAYLTLIETGIMHLKDVCWGQQPLSIFDTQAIVDFSWYGISMVFLLSLELWWRKECLCSGIQSTSYLLKRQKKFWEKCELNKVVWEEFTALPSLKNQAQLFLYLQWHELLKYLTQEIRYRD